MKKGFKKTGMASGLQAVILVMMISLMPSAGSAEALSLEDALRNALENNPMIQAEQFSVKAGEEKINQARSGVLPQIFISEQATRTTNPMWAFGNRLNQQSITSSDFDPERLNDPEALSNWATALSVNWPVYDSGQTWYGIQQAELNREAALLSEQRKRQSVMAGTAVFYLQALLSMENERVLFRMNETAESHKKLITSRYNEGFVSKSDLLRSQVRIADLRQQITNARNQTQIVLCRLNTHMGVEISKAHELTTLLESGENISGTIEDWVESSLKYRPDLQHARLVQQIYEKELRKAEAGRLPSFAFSGSYEINSEDFEQTGSNYTVGAQLSLPIFSGGRITSKIREADILLRQSKVILKGTEQQVRAEVRTGFLEAQSSWERIQVAYSSIKQSEESLRIVKNRYQSGLFTITDLLDAEDMVQQSLTDHLKAVHDYLAAAVRLNHAAGNVVIETDIMKRQP